MNRFADRFANEGPLVPDDGNGNRIIRDAVDPPQSPAGRGVIADNFQRSRDHEHPPAPSAARYTGRSRIAAQHAIDAFGFPDKLPRLALKAAT